MLNVLYLIVSIVMIFVLVGIVFFIKGRNGINNSLNYLSYSCICMVAVVACNALSYASIDENAIRLWFYLKVIGTSIMPVTLFLFSAEFNKLELELNKNLIKALFIVPVITIVLTLTNTFHHIMYASVEIVYNGNDNFKELISAPGKWSYISMIYNNALYLVSLFIFLLKNENDDEYAVQRQNIFSVGFIIMLACNYIEFFDLLGSFNISFIGSTAAIFIFYKGLVLYPYNNFNDIAKNTVFEKITSMALVFDNNGKIVQYNKSAAETFAFMNIELDGANYENLIKTWLLQANGFIEKNDAGRMISVQKLGKRYYYQLTETEIKDSRGTVFGTFVELSNITLQQESIKELFRLVNTDQLTGLYNRRYFDNMCVQYDKDVFYPLAVFSGDLNRLKYTNDTFGHAYGDRLIQLISSILKKAAPKNSVICRHGGDEFSILIPNASRGMVIDFIRRVDKICSVSGDEPFGTPSISLGFAFKNSHDQDIKDVIDEADKMMYEIKARKHDIADGVGSALDFMNELSQIENNNGYYIQ